ncbi:UDP-glucose 4-epimerase GalE [Halobacillus litoralis]|uniref:UDP-glucose 4-epimerase GalE n=1 Tax=Halobacillus litoralis TaxID=45668 RepID=UPI001CD2E5A9|nr:UDP-glucose 4-epimerase GalE [Halobacillus litoralis]MCA0971456.1 UDP-glucose 4-epimerase GalE [Halobacillus litoralis]
MNVLVTGGTGYIGSHTCVSLLQAGHSVVIVDNLSNSSRETLEQIESITGEEVMFYENDVTDEKTMDEIFTHHSFDGVIHFAGFKAVGESVNLPSKYYRNNLLSTIVLADLCLKHNVEKFVFSSSATVYGENASPMVESMELLPTTNPYGETKAMSERILSDISKANPNFHVSLLRYFNPVGAHESGLIGESPNGIPNNLMPYVTQVAKGIREKLSVFGDDYDTVDGSGVRDYVHVMDLAEGHIAALEHLEEGVRVYNLGTGKGTSVLELVEAFEQVNQVPVPYDIVQRRPGDLATCFADASKAENELGWTAKRGIQDMCRDAWNYQSRSSQEALSENER